MATVQALRLMQGAHSAQHLRQVGVPSQRALPAAPALASAQQSSWAPWDNPRVTSRATTEIEDNRWSSTSHTDLKLQCNVWMMMMTSLMMTMMMMMVMVVLFLFSASHIGHVECTRIQCHPDGPPTLLNRCGEQSPQCRPTRMFSCNPCQLRMP